MTLPIPRTLPLIVTDAGRAKAVSAIEGGLALRLTHIAVGAGQVIPTAATTALADERERELIVSWAKTDQYTIEAAALIVNTGPAFLAREIGIYSDGTLVAIGYRADGLVTMTNGVPYAYSGTLMLTELPADTNIVIEAELTLDLAFLAPLVAYARAILVLQRQVLDLETRLRQIEDRDTHGITRFPPES